MITDQSTLIVNFFVKNKDWGRGRGGLLTFFSEKGGLLEGGGGLIEDLRYFQNITSSSRFQ